ncbi:MAG: hypothetical protein DMF76_18360 [Acidobacteria bacterium]|nr:MAG: hypothetical protein DMF76_18360 [Acidobacteriota bacterium]
MQLFSVRREQLHSKRPTLNVQRLIQKDRPRTLSGAMLQDCGCATIINIGVAAATTARSTYFSTADPPTPKAFASRRRVRSRGYHGFSDQISSHKVHQGHKGIGLHSKQ